MNSMQASVQFELGSGEKKLRPPIELRSIVAATDLSAPAQRAADRAAGIARSASASRMLVHVVSGSALDEVRRWLDTGGAEQSIVDDVRGRLRELATDLRGSYNVTVEDLLVTGNAVDEIVHVAHERHADLVVTGTLGAGFLRSRLVGSTAERVVRRSQRPVLMVRQVAQEPYRRVLVPVDFSGWSGPSVEIAMRVAPGAQVVLMHVVEVPFESRLRIAGVEGAAIEAHRAKLRSDVTQKLHDLAATAGVGAGRWTPLALDGRSSPWLHIVQQAQERDCDLIVIGKHGRNALEELLLGSATSMVIAKTSSDVLVCATSDRM